MKLWKKITGISCAVLVLLFSGIFLTVTHQTEENFMAHAREQVLQDHGEQMIDLLRQLQKAGADRETARKAQVKYLFNSIGDESAVLIWDGELLCSHVPIDPRDFLEPPEDAATASLETEIQGIPYLLCASQIPLMGQYAPGYYFYTAVDLSPRYGEFRQMALTTAELTAGGLLLSLALIVALVYFTMKPLDRLTETAARIAEGSYGERTGISRKDEIGELSRSFDRMADSVQTTVSTLQEQNRRQKLFIGAVSHEFKTPLTSLLLSADSLQNTCMSEDAQQDAIASMEAQCRWLEKITGSLMKLLSVETELSLQPVSLRELMDQLRDCCQDLLGQYQVSLEIACDDTVFLLDRELMLCALRNLVHNAARASKPGQAVQIYVHRTTFEVTDQGKGIPQEDLPRITEPFYMVDKSRSKKQGGTGLGLALVNEIVKAHGGTLEIESRLDCGTTVSFTLPKTTEEKRN